MKLARRKLPRSSLARGGRSSPGPGLAQRWTSTASESTGTVPSLPRGPDLLDQARVQWQHGDWDSLKRLDLRQLHDHQDRAKLALLAAAGHMQSGSLDDARVMLRHAVEWGCSKRLVSQLLIANVHNVLGRAASIAGLEDKARGHFETSIATVHPSTDTGLLGHARAVRELTSLGMLPQALAFAGQGAEQARRPQLATAHAKAHQRVVDLELEWLRDRVLFLQKQANATKPQAGIAKTAGASSPATTPAPADAPRYHGLHGLDKKLEAYLDMDGGFFVELGANDGIAQSNTLHFERDRGWRGVLIEPILHNFLKCQQNRSPENSFFCAACVSSDYEDPYVRLTYANLMTAPKGVESDIADPTAHAQSGAVYLPAGERPVEVMAVARTLGSLLDEAGVPPVMDLLSLDVEGAEIEVLKGLDHQRHRFRYLLVECRDPHRLGNYLADAGYVLVDKLSQHDYLFCAR